MNDQTSVGNRVQNLNIGPEFDTYTRVIIHAGQITDAQGNTTDLDYIAGDTSGRTMEVSDPNGTQAKANALLAKLQNSKFQYQPYEADAALLDPAAEPGDGVSVSDTFSAIYRRDVTYSSLMAADISAPSDEEIEHEFPYIPKSDREYKRETQFTRLQLKINANAITAEVSRVDRDVFNPNNSNSIISKINIEAGRITQEVSDRTTAVNGLDTRLTSQINQTASEINATVSQERSDRISADNTKLNHTNTTQAFGWSLTSTAFLLKNNNTEVFRFDKDGLKFKSNGADVFTVTRTGGLYVKGNGEFTGKITANEGTVGGISLNKDVGLYYGSKNTATSTANGFLISKSGAIYLGAYNSTYSACPFQVTASGNLTANQGTIGGISLNRSYGLYTNGKTSATSTANGFFISNSGAIYLGAYNSTNKACPFQVTSSGALTATSGKIGGFTISASAIYNGKSAIGSDTTAGVFLGTGGIALGTATGKNLFKVTSGGAMTLKYEMGSRDDTSKTAGTSGMYIGTDGIALGFGKFKAKNNGEVTASNLTISGGTIKLGSKTSLSDNYEGVYIGSDGIALGKSSAFKVTKAGEITATSGKIGGFKITDKYIGNWTYNTSGHTDGHGVWIDAEQEYIQLGKCRINNDGKIYVLKNPDQGLGEGNKNVEAYIDTDGTFYNGSVDGWIGDGNGRWTAAANVYGAGAGISTQYADYDTFTKHYIITESVLIGNDTQGSLHLGGLGFKVVNINGVNVWGVDMT